MAVYLEGISGRNHHKEKGKIEPFSEIALQRIYKAAIKDLESCKAAIEVLIKASNNSQEEEADIEDARERIELLEFGESLQESATFRPTIKNLMRFKEIIVQSLDGELDEDGISGLQTVMETFKTNCEALQKLLKK